MIGNHHTKQPWTIQATQEDLSGETGKAVNDTCWISSEDGVDNVNS